MEDTEDSTNEHKKGNGGSSGSTGGCGGGGSGGGNGIEVTTAFNNDEVIKKKFSILFNLQSEFHYYTFI